MRIFISTDRSWPGVGPAEVEIVDKPVSDMGADVTLEKNKVPATRDDVQSRCRNVPGTQCPLLYNGAAETCPCEVYVDGTFIELLAPTEGSFPITRVIEKQGEGSYVVAMKVVFP